VLVFTLACSKHHWIRTHVISVSVYFCRLQQTHHLSLTTFLLTLLWIVKRSLPTTFSQTLHLGLKRT